MISVQQAELTFYGSKFPSSPSKHWFPVILGVKNQTDPLLEPPGERQKLIRWPWVTPWPYMMAAIFYSIKQSITIPHFQIRKKQNKILAANSKKGKRSSLNVQAQLVSKQTYLHWEIKTKTVEGRRINARRPPKTLFVLNALPLIWYVWMKTPGAPNTESASHPGSSLLENLQTDTAKR